MAIQIQGNGGTIAEVDGTNFRASRVSLRPLDYGAFGQYSIAMLSGTMAAGIAGNAEIMQFRWTDATRKCAVQAVILDGLSGSATAFTAGFAKVDLMIARSFTAAGTGGTAATITGNNAKLRTSMGTTLLGEMRTATTAALGAGTKTLDTQAIGQIGFSIGTTASVNYLGQTYLFNVSETQQHPIVLAQNEGLAMRVTVPATGTWQFGATVVWTELTEY